MKKLFSLLLALMMALSLFSCAKTPAANAPAPSAEPTAAPTEAVPDVTEPPAEPAHYPVTLTDHAGRTVTVEQAPERIVSGYYISTSAFIALGLKDDLVGIEAKANKRPIYKLSAPELIDLPNVGTAKEFDLEGCIALEPDLVVLPVKLKSAAESLEQLGISVLLVNPESQTQLEEMITLIAQATDTEERCGALLSRIGELRAMLADTVGSAEAPTVYLAGNSALLSTAGSGMYQSDMIAQAGGVNVAASEIEDNSWVEISYEQLLAWDPDFILLASDASYSVEDVLADPNLADCAAVQNGRVIAMPGDAEAWDSPVPSGILGSVWLAAALHGDLLSMEQAGDLADAFYLEFYGFDYAG